MQITFSFSADSSSEKSNPAPLGMSVIAVLLSHSASHFILTFVEYQN